MYELAQADEADKDRQAPPPAADGPVAQRLPDGAVPASKWQLDNKGWMYWLILVGFLALITWPGLNYRRWAWDFTEPGRFRFDIARNFNFGLMTLREGFLNMYENQVRDQPDTAHKLDYPPLRLATFEAWAAWKLHQNPANQRWSGEYKFNAPLMEYYTFLEWMAALGALLVVLTWLGRCAEAHGPPGTGAWTGFWRALAAFGLLWFDPGMAIIGHGWPSPNIWAVPFYLWAVLFCLWDWWFVAGVVMGVGAMLQGQLLFTTGLFILWPLFARRPGKALGWISGFMLSFMGIAGGWMLSLRPDIQEPRRMMNWPAVWWVGISVAAMVLLSLRRPLGRWMGRCGCGRWPWLKWLGPTVVAAILFYPARMQSWQWVVMAAVAAAAAAWGLWQARWPIQRYVLALATAGCLLLCIPYFGASTAWWEIGFLYGAERFPNVGGKLTANLPTILQDNFKWERISDKVTDIPAHWLWGLWPAKTMEVNIRQVLVLGFAILFVAGAMAAARQYRRYSPRLLIALVLPWVLFYTVLPQMSPRYPVFIAGVGAICIGQSLGMWLLVLLFSILTVQQTAYCMMMGNNIWRRTVEHPLFNGHMRWIFDRLNPGLSWAIVLAAGVFFYMALASDCKKPRLLAPLAEPM